MTEQKKGKPHDLNPRKDPDVQRGIDKYVKPGSTTERSTSKETTTGIITDPLTPDTGRQVQLGSDIPITQENRKKRSEDEEG